MNESLQFDFIVIGAGTAGCVVAARLSEGSNVRVALIEAGGSHDHWIVSTPAAVGAVIAYREFNWGLSTVPQAALSERRIPLPRGRLVGGSGSMNGMVYHRGHPRDYQDWAARGLPDWSWAQVLPYFTRSECNLDYPSIAISRPRRPMARLIHPPAEPHDATYISAVQQRWLCTVRRFCRTESRRGWRSGKEPFIAADVFPRRALILTRR